jgi:hypothetical protein
MEKGSKVKGFTYLCIFLNAVAIIICGIVGYWLGVFLIGFGTIPMLYFLIEHYRYEADRIINDDWK